jgi:membrane protease YdiL (CAAX protease family)
VQSTSVIDRAQWVPEFRTGVTVVSLTAGVAVSEGFLYAGQVRYALLGHLALLLVCTTAPVYLADGKELYQAFLLVPVFRLTNVGLPEFVFPAIQLLELGLPLDAELSLHWLSVVYGVFLPVVFVAIRYNDVVDLDPGWRTGALLIPVVFLLSVILATVEHAIFPPALLIPADTLVEFLVVTVVLVGVVSLAEELLFRGLLQGSLQAYLGPWSGIVVASAVFAMLHSVYQDPMVVGYAFGLGLLLGTVYEKTRSFSTVVLLHGLTSVFLYSVIPAAGPWFTLG